jgi:hypothetical protein
VLKKTRIDIHSLWDKIKEKYDPMEVIALMFFSVFRKASPTYSLNIDGDEYTHISLEKKGKDIMLSTKKGQTTFFFRLIGPTMGKQIKKDEGFALTIIDAFSSLKVDQVRKVLKLTDKNDEELIDVLIMTDLTSASDDLLGALRITNLQTIIDNSSVFKVFDENPKYLTYLFGVMFKLMIVRSQSGFTISSAVMKFIINHKEGSLIINDLVKKRIEMYGLTGNERKTTRAPTEQTKTWLNAMK